MFSEIVQPSVAADEETAAIERFNVEICVSERGRIADDLFNNVLEGDDSFRPAKLIEHNRHPLGMGKKAAQEVDRGHGLGNEGGRNQGLGVMARGISQKLFHIDQAK